MTHGVALQMRRKFGNLAQLHSLHKKITEVASLEIVERHKFYLITKEKFWQKPTYADIFHSLLNLKKICQERKRTQLAFLVTFCSFKKFLSDDIPTSSATSLIVNRRLFRIISRTRATVSFVLLVDGLTGRSLSLTDVLPSLNRLNHSKHVVRDRTSFSKACCKSSKVSLELFPYLKQNFTHTFYSFHYGICHATRLKHGKLAPKWLGPYPIIDSQPDSPNVTILKKNKPLGPDNYHQVYNLTLFQNQQGIYYESHGVARLSHGSWELVISLNVQSLISKYHVIMDHYEATTTIFKNMLNKFGNVEIEEIFSLFMQQFSRATLPYLNEIEANHRSLILTIDNDGNRVQRGLGQAFRRMANVLYGVCSNIDYLQKQINTTIQNLNKLTFGAKVLEQALLFELIVKFTLIIYLTMEERRRVVPLVENTDLDLVPEFGLEIKEVEGGRQVTLRLNKVMLGEILIYKYDGYMQGFQRSELRTRVDNVHEELCWEVHEQHETLTKESVICKCLLGEFLRVGNRRVSPIPIQFLCIMKVQGQLPYTIEEFKNETSIFYENQGEIRIIGAHWELLTYVALSDYDIRHYQLETEIRNMDKHCKGNMSDSEMCFKYENVLKTTFNEVAVQRHQMYESIGRYLSSDTTIGEFTTRGKNSNERMIHVIKDQTTVVITSITGVDSVSKELNKLYTELRIKQKGLESNIEELVNHTYTLETLILSNRIFSIFTALITQYSYEIQTLSAIITAARTDVLHPSLVTPSELAAQLVVVKLNLPLNFNLPMGTSPNEIHEFTKITEIAIFYSGNQIMILIKIPLVTLLELTLFKIIPIPHPVDTDQTTNKTHSIILKPEYQYVGITKNRRQFTTFTETELLHCTETEREIYLLRKLQLNLKTKDIEIENNELRRQIKDSFSRDRENKINTNKLSDEIQKINLLRKRSVYFDDNNKQKNNNHDYNENRGRNYNRKRYFDNDKRDYRNNSPYPYRRNDSEERNYSKRNNSPYPSRFYNRYSRDNSKDNNYNRGRSYSRERKHNYKSSRESSRDRSYDRDFITYKHSDNKDRETRGNYKQ
ncbi:serine/threonine-protein kinase fray2-like, partial [Aphis craccivora]